tara:strand:- start:5862 stop:6005 length:144 start_codon:yes stop_codon:yes gene_type:complete
MIRDRYKNSIILSIIKPYLLMSEQEVEALSNNEKDLINYYKNEVCIK